MFETQHQGLFAPESKGMAVQPRYICSALTCWTSKLLSVALDLRVLGVKVEQGVCGLAYVEDFCQMSVWTPS